MSNSSFNSSKKQRNKRTILCYLEAMELFYRLRAELGQMFCWFGRIKANKINID